MRKKIVRLEDLPEGTTKRFSFQRDGMRVDAFVANFKGDIVAYENLCRHLPITLDYGDGEFFSSDGSLFVCQTHGAFYEPKTGLCIDGPCTGASLIPLETEQSDGNIFLVR
ncbi:MAG: Rieske 2Fe-2S domain-containing protein [Verrucomicrobiota bacterium]|nr:Rieske 2Fe-2S domain-containing protein [Verrucomicrobiota bacterium]